jgi:hypothetical protein
MASVALDSSKKAREFTTSRPTNSRLEVTFQTGMRLHDFALYIAQSKAVFSYVDPKSKPSESRKGAKNAVISEANQ